MKLLRNTAFTAALMTAAVMSLTSPALAQDWGWGWRGGGWVPGASVGALIVGRRASRRCLNFVRVRGIVAPIAISCGRQLQSRPLGVHPTFSQRPFTPRTQKTLGRDRICLGLDRPSLGARLYCSFEVQATGGTLSGTDFP